MKPASISDYRALAKRRLPKFLFEYIDGGSYDEVTLRRSIEALREVQLRQRVLCNVDQIDLSTEIFGQKLAMPIGLGPIGLAGMNARRGEVQAARAAETAGVPFCLSTVSACGLGELSAKVKTPVWLQLYMIRDRGFMAELIEQAKAADVKRMLFTVDMPLPGTRYRDYRSGLAGAPGFWGDARRVFQGAMRPRWAWDVGIMGRPHGLGNVAPVLGPNTGLEDFFAWMRNNFDSRVTWKDLEWLRDHWDRDIILKGVLDVEDAQMAAKMGFDGLVVSNHGGRQLDGVPATADALPAIARTVGDKFPILVDGGVRSGLDVVRMLALGADMVLLGRAWAYALAGGGQAAVSHVLSLVQAEMRVAMALCGVTSIDQIGPDLLVNGPKGPAAKSRL